MKILTGNLRGRVIAYKPNPRLRPTSDKSRKAIFDMLQGQMPEKTVLDLFSGTGAVGFEALSQGASFVTFVESEKVQGELIKNNLLKLDLVQKSTVIIGDALSILAKLSREEKEFDFIFMDPPYETGLGERTLEVLAKSAILKKDTLIILECRSSKWPPKVEQNFTCLKNKVHGDTRLLIYRLT